MCGYLQLINGVGGFRKEHQNFRNPFFDHFLRQHSPVPILTGFFRTKNRDDDLIVDLSSSAKQVVHPVH